MSKRLLLGCYDIPGWGGASTVLYLLFERMQRDGIEVSCVNLVSKKDEAFLRGLFGENFGNPHALKNVHTCILEEPLWRPHENLASLISHLEPDLLFGFGFIAARLFELSAERIPVVFMTAGSRQVELLMETGAIRDFIGFRRSVEHGIFFPMPPNHQERRAVEGCDLIIVHSPLVRRAFDHFFPYHAGKIYANTVSVADLIYPEAGRFKHLAKPFAERDIDAIFVASSWKRPGKNYGLVRKIISRGDGLNIHVVGNVERRHSPAAHHGVVTRRDDLYALLGRSKSLACPSFVDAAPGVLFEASAMGCNVIASENCGNWQLCNERLLADSCSPRAFLEKIGLSVNGAYSDNRDRFRGGYKDLVETLSVF